MEHQCIQYITSEALKIKYLGSMNKAQEIREGLKQWKEGSKERERKGDKKDRENRLTSLHLIGSSCNHKKPKQKKTKQTIDDRKQSETGKKIQDSKT